LKKRGASTASLIGVLIVGLLVGAGITYVAAPSLISANTTTVSGGVVTTTVTTANAQASGLCNGQTVTIGALNDLSGGLSAQGKGDLAAEQMAITDVNAYTKQAGCNLNFALNSQDYKLDTPTALSELTAMGSAGIQVVVGPLNSGAAAGILNYADSNHIVLISPSSTSLALAIPNDYLFRTAPNDGAQGQADAKELLASGAKAVIVINRDDTYGDGLANSTVTWLKLDDPNIVIGGPTKYDPTTSDFTSIISTMSSQYTSLSNQVGAANVAIYVVAFQEYGSILSQTKTQAASLLSTKLPWFGMDGIAQNSDLSNSSSNVASTAAQVGVYSTLFGVLSNNSKSAAFYSRIAGTPAGAEILGGGAFYTFEGYDDVWLAALSIISAGANSGTAIQAIFPSVSSNFYGLTGGEVLTAAGDRALFAGSGYQIWRVVSIGAASWGWILAGQWDYATNSVSWNGNNAPA
jgi:branched-chain amino acid transport system substrate-binding protein